MGLVPTGSLPEEIKLAPSQDDIPFWRAPWDFAVHAIVGISVFAIVAAPTVLLDIAVRKMEAYKISGAIVVGLTAAEYGLFAVDLILFAVFLWRTSKRIIARL